MPDCYQTSEKRTSNAGGGGGTRPEKIVLLMPNLAPGGDTTTDAEI
jgi:hypothetical protein